MIYDVKHIYTNITFQKTVYID